MVIRRRPWRARLEALERRHLPDAETAAREERDRQRTAELLQSDPVARELVERIEARWREAEPVLDAEHRRVLEETHNPLLADPELIEPVLALFHRMGPDPAYSDPNETEPSPWPPYGRWPD
jgi:hypothetical protein